MRPRLLALSAALWMTSSATGCGDDHHHGAAGLGADEYYVPCESAPGSGASDESFVKFVNAEAARQLVTDPTEAARLVAPVAGATLSPDAPPTFRLEIGAGGGGAGDAGARASGEGCRGPRPRGSRWAWLGGLFVGTAWAHCPGVTGENYLLRLSDGTTPVFTALLSTTTYTPDAGKWRRALAGRRGRSLSLTLVRAVLTGGNVTKGPYVAGGAPVVFLVAP